MGLLSWMVMGLAAGWLARLFTRERGNGALGDFVIGVLGALIGGFLAAALFKPNSPVDTFHLTTLGVSFLGAVFFVAVHRVLPAGTPI